MYYDWIQQHKQQLKFGSIAAVVLMIAWLVVVYISHIGKLPLTIDAVPIDAHITINGVASSNGVTWLPANTYTIRVAKDGFQTVTKQTTISNNNQRNVVVAALTPQSTTAKNWAASHQNDYSSVQADGATEAANTGAAIKRAYPITNVLPINDPYYQIDYSTDNRNQLMVIISTPSPRYRYFAIQKIRTLGFNPTDYHIIFKDFINPLGAPHA